VIYPELLGVAGPDNGPADYLPVLILLVLGTCSASAVSGIP